MSGWRDELRSRLAAGTLVLLVIALSVGTVVGRADRVGYLFILVAFLVAFTPVALVKCGWAFRIVALVLLVVGVYALLFGGLALVVAVLPVLVAAPARAPGPGGRSWAILGGGVALAGLGGLFFAFMVIPAEGSSLTVCFRSSPTSDEMSPIYSTQTERGDELLPGVEQVFGGVITTIGFEPFADEVEIERVEARARAHPLVSGVVRGPHGPCPSSAG